MCIIFCVYLLLVQFRNSVGDILKEDHDDYFLLRWLRGNCYLFIFIYIFFNSLLFKIKCIFLFIAARKWNRLEAEKMLRAVKLINYMTHLFAKDLSTRYY